MQKQLEQYFCCKVKIAEYKNKLPLPIFMTMREITMVEIYGVNFAIIDVMKETELSVAAMKKQKATILIHFYPEVTVEKMSSYRKKQ